MRDSNPRGAVNALPVFKTGPFNHLGNPAYCSVFPFSFLREERAFTDDPQISEGMAGAERIELSCTVLETAILPLDDAPIWHPLMESNHAQLGQSQLYYRYTKRVCVRDERISTVKLLTFTADRAQLSVNQVTGLEPATS